MAIPAFGTPAMQELIEHQIKKLNELGYEAFSSVNFDTHCHAKIVYRNAARPAWTCSNAKIHDGDREDCQRAMHEAMFYCLERAWNHYREYEA